MPLRRRGDVMGKKYQLFVRMWVKQTDKLYDSLEEGYKAARKLADKADIQMHDIRVEEANENRS